MAQFIRIHHFTFTLILFTSKTNELLFQKIDEKYDYKFSFSVATFLCFPHSIDVFFSTSDEYLNPTKYTYTSFVWTTKLCLSSSTPHFGGKMETKNSTLMGVMAKTTTREEEEEKKL